MTTKTAQKGTCPACFRSMTVEHDQMHKHGWREQGGRQVGSYHNAWHVGACFGVGYAPFELSPEGTKEYLKQRLRPYLASMQAELERLGTRPPLRTERRLTRAEREVLIQAKHAARKEAQATGQHYEHQPVPWSEDVTIQNGEVLKDEYGTTYRTYDQVLAGEIQQVEQTIEAIRHDIASCEKAVAEWTLKPLIVVTTGPVVHLKKTRALNDGRVRIWPACTWRVGSVARYKMTEFAGDVTCAKCLKHVV